MKTDTEHVEFIREGEKYVYLLEHLELAMTPNQIDRIISQHNDGAHLLDIAKQEKRHPAEVIVAILHQSIIGYKSNNRGRLKPKRPIARLI